ncbi:MAG: hypothetical protein WBJ18_00800 [Coprothermobacter proteolyticus]
MQNWTAKKVYFYAVSLVLLLLILFNVGSLLWQLVQITILPPLTAGTWNYEDAKRQLLWEKYGTTENVTVTPEEVQTFIDQKEKESQRLTLYYNWQVVVKNALYLAVIAPLYWYHWKVARTLE